MTHNMGNLDRLLRTGIAVALVILGLTGVLQGTVAVIAYVVAAIFVLTSLVSFCPAYRLIGINTCGKP